MVEVFWNPSESPQESSGEVVHDSWAVSQSLGTSAGVNEQIRRNSSGSLTRCHTGPSLRQFTTPNLQEPTMKTLVVQLKQTVQWMNPQEVTGCGCFWPGTLMVSGAGNGGMRHELSVVIVVVYH